jgi:hypothetical protein
VQDLAVLGPAVRIGGPDDISQFAGRDAGTPLHGVEDPALDRRKAQPAWHYGLAAAQADRLSDFSWEFGCNALMLHVRFSLQLGEKRCGSKGEWWTLNQRVQGSSPCAPTTQINPPAGMR